MSSRLVVEVCRIEEIRNHNNAEKLEIAIIKGWQLVVPKGIYSVGDKVVYFPPDTVLPVEVTDKFGVTKYTSKKEQGQRIIQAKLRGEPSFGLAVGLDDDNWDVGHDVSEFYGAEKYIPPVKPANGDDEVDHPLFVKYTDIDNLRNFPDLFNPGERIVLTEKIHGRNLRIGYINGELMSGSRSRRKKLVEEEEMKSHLTWFPYTMEPVKNLLEYFKDKHNQVILFGELFGKVQIIKYGVNGIDFRAFDLMIDGKYIDTKEFFNICKDFGIQTVPIVEEMVFESIDQISSYSKGKTFLNDNHIREGVVIRPEIERHDPKIGRVIAKYVSDDYLLSKFYAEDTTDF